MPEYLAFVSSLGLA